MSSLFNPLLSPIPLRTIQPSIQSCSDSSLRLTKGFQKTSTPLRSRIRAASTTTQTAASDLQKQDAGLANANREQDTASAAAAGRVLSILEKPTPFKKNDQVQNASCLAIINSKNKAKTASECEKAQLPIEKIKPASMGTKTINARPLNQPDSEAGRQTLASVAQSELVLSAPAEPVKTTIRRSSSTSEDAEEVLRNDKKSESKTSQNGKTKCNGNVKPVECSSDEEERTIAKSSNVIKATKKHGTTTFQRKQNTVKQTIAAEDCSIPRGKPESPGKASLKNSVVIKNDNNRRKGGQVKITIQDNVKSTVASKRKLQRDESQVCPSVPSRPVSKQCCSSKRKESPHLRSKSSEEPHSAGPVVPKQWKCYDVEGDINKDEMAKEYDEIFLPLKKSRTTVKTPVRLKSTMKPSAAGSLSEQLSQSKSVDRTVSEDSQSLESSSPSQPSHRFISSLRPKYRESLNGLSGKKGNRTKSKTPKSGTRMKHKPVREMVVSKQTVDYVMKIVKYHFVPDDGASKRQKQQLSTLAQMINDEIVAVKVPYSKKPTNYAGLDDVETALDDQLVDYDTDIKRIDVKILEATEELARLEKEKEAAMWRESTHGDNEKETNNSFVEVKNQAKEAKMQEHHNRMKTVLSLMASIHAANERQQEVAK